MGLDGPTSSSTREENIHKEECAGMNIALLKKKPQNYRHFNTF
jgi:hypothetical protein